MNETKFQVAEKCVVPEEWKTGIGHDFRHYKGKMYRLLGLAPHSETLESMADRCLKSAARARDSDRSRT